MSYAPQESSYDLFLERTFMASGFLAGVGYGVQFALYCACMRLLWIQRKSKRRSFLLMTYISALFSLDTIYAACTARDLELNYIDDRDYPGGPLQYFLATSYLPVNSISVAVFFVANVLADALLLWRCKIIWSAFLSGFYLYLVMAFPVILILASFVMGLLWTIQSSSPGFSLYSGVSVALGLPYFAISLSLNIILTFLIVTRLLIHRRNISAILGKEHGRTYTSVATLTIESALLYSVFSLIFLVTYAVNNPINQIFLGVLTPIQLISTYLIIYRVADGSAWRSDTLSTSTGTGINFQKQNRSTYPDSSEPKSTTLTTGTAGSFGSTGASESKEIVLLNVTGSLRKGHDESDHSDYDIEYSSNV